MVVLLDLEDDDAFDPFARPRRLSGPYTPDKDTPVTTGSKEDEEKTTVETERPNPNFNAFSIALGCYP